jgi:leader peptidase (prepilin peptidase)/N-methyltransferase
MFEAAWSGGAIPFDPVAWSAVAVAPVIGSFLGVVIRRLPAGEPIAWSRSRCDSCRAALTARDLVPLLSWLMARGRCRFCAAPIGWFYPAVELAALAVAVVAAVRDAGAAAWLDCVLGWWLLALGWIDARHWLLPDMLTLPLILAGLGVGLAIEPASAPAHAVAAAIGYLGFRGLAYAYRRLRGRDGLGAGDAKLLAAGGAWLGVGALPPVILIAALGGLLTALALRLAGVRLGAASAMPFGPFLALAIWLVWLFPGVLA